MYRKFDFSLTHPASQSCFMLHCVLASLDFPFLFCSFPFTPHYGSHSVRPVFVWCCWGLFTLSFGSLFVVHRSPFTVHRSLFAFAVRIHVLSSSSPFSFPSSFAFASPWELISSVHVRVSHLHCCHVQAISLFSYCLLVCCFCYVWWSRFSYFC